MFSSQVWASSPGSFSADCTEGETHRYDGGNGFYINGGKIPDPEHGWITENWGGLKIFWIGGDNIKVGKLDFSVLNTDEGVVSAVWAGIGTAINVYSFVIDLQLGEAVYSQVQASALGASRQIKVRSQNLICEILQSNP